MPAAEADATTRAFLIAVSPWLPLITKTVVVQGQPAPTTGWGGVPPPQPSISRLTLPCLYASADPATPAPTTIRSQVCTGQAFQGSAIIHHQQSAPSPPLQPLHCCAPPDHARSYRWKVLGALILETCLRHCALVAGTCSVACTELPFLVGRCQRTCAKAAILACLFSSFRSR